MVPSALIPSTLRTLSVITILSAVSGTVLLVNGHRATSSGKVSLDASASLTAATSAFVVSAPAVAGSDLARSELTGPELARDEAAAMRAGVAERLARAERKAEAVREAAAARARAARTAARDPKSLARIMLADRGWGAGQFSCLVSLWNRESRWNYRAANPYSGAYGIPQALPGSKMASAGADWRTNPATQIRWGLKYIAGRYGTPCGAWGHSQAAGWY